VSVRGPGIEVESPKRVDCGLDGLGTDSPVARLAPGPPNSVYVFRCLGVYVFTF
jgi:hypothetical protein